MRYVFIDESRISKGRFQLFGSLWLPRAEQSEFREEYWRLWDQEFPSRRSELKWTKVSKAKLKTYKNFIDLFATQPRVDFRCIVLDTHAIDYKKYHQGSKELGFYKFLYFFISRNIEKDYRFKKLSSHYQIFMDSRRRDDEIGCLKDLRHILNNRLDDTCVGIEPPCIRSIDAVKDSRTSPEIQIVDVLTGAVGYRWEGFDTSKPKLELIQHIEDTFGLALEESTPY